MIPPPAPLEQLIDAVRAGETTAQRPFVQILAGILARTIAARLGRDWGRGEPRRELGKQLHRRVLRDYARGPAEAFVEDVVLDLCARRLRAQALVEAPARGPTEAAGRAFAELANLLRPESERFVRAYTYGKAEPELRADIVHDALLRCVRGFNPARPWFVAYLRIAVRNEARGVWRKSQSGIRRREVALGDEPLVARDTRDDTRVHLQQRVQAALAFLGLPPSEAGCRRADAWRRRLPRTAQFNFRDCLRTYLDPGLSPERRVVLGDRLRGLVLKHPLPPEEPLDLGQAS